MHILLAVAILRPGLEPGVESLRAGRAAEAESRFERACPDYDGPERGYCLLLLGMARQGSGKLETARSAFEAASPLLKTGGPRFADALAMAYRYWGELGESEDLLRQALAIQLTLSDALPAAATRRRLADLLLRANRVDEAAREWRLAQAAFAADASPDLGVERAHLRAAEGRLLLAQGHATEGRLALFDALRAKEAIFGAAHRLTASAVRELAAALESEGAFDRAAPLWRRAAWIERRTR